MVIKSQMNSTNDTKFYKVRLAEEPPESNFYAEYSIITMTADAVNSFNALYKKDRFGAKGPSTHEQQDLYRAMLVFACAGLDIFVKQLVKAKLLSLVEVDAQARDKFQKYVRRELNKKEGDMLNLVAFALIEHAPRDIFLREYLESLTRDSLQSVDQLCKVSEASGLDTHRIFSNTKMTSLKDAFAVRNEIIHEMDINVSSGRVKKTTGYRTRRQRKAGIMETHTKVILDLACEIFSAYKKKYESANIAVKKASPA